MVPAGSQRYPLATVPHTPHTVGANYASRLWYPFTEAGQAALPRAVMGTLCLSDIFLNPSTMGQIERDNKESLEKCTDSLTTDMARRAFLSVVPDEGDFKNILHAYHTLAYLVFGMGYHGEFGTMHTALKSIIVKNGLISRAEFADTLSSQAIAATNTHRGHAVKRMLLGPTLHAMAYKRSRISAQ